MNPRIPLIGIAIGLVLLVAAPTSVSAGLPQWRIRLWMLPAMDDLDNKACLTQRWHSQYYDPLKALDWKDDCGEQIPKGVRFRALGANIDSAPGGYAAYMYAVVSNLPPQACGLDYTHTGRVALWSFEANLKGFMYYGHTSLYSGHQFNVLFQDGGNLSNARLNSIGIGSTFDDGLTNSDNCWSGFHLHETNSNDANKKWDAWNSFYNTAATFCECHTNTASSNWIRRMTWTLVGFE